MTSGWIALLDDLATLTKVAASSLDDAAGQAAKAGSKAAGIVIDDAAVTPRYVVGLAAERELPIIAKIAGRIEFVRDYKAKRKIAIVPEEGDPVE